MTDSDEALVFGQGTRKGIVSAEWVGADSGDAVWLFSRTDNEVRREQVPFAPFLWVEDESWVSGDPEPTAVRRCEGAGALPFLVFYSNWATVRRAADCLRRKTGHPPSSREAPYFLVHDPVQQFLMATGETFFNDMEFSDIRRLQLDIETQTGVGYDFPNAERESDRILAVGLSDTTGWSELISVRDRDEKALLERLVEAVRERDPDVIEGHNIFSFDLPYIAARARRHGVRLQWGRDGSVPQVRSGRFTAGERATSYPKTTIFGRSILDTYFLAQIYDVSHRSLPSLGLKEIARHFGIADENRTYIRGSRITQTFREDPDRVLRYLKDDLSETRGVADLLAPVYVAQARILPFSFQDVCLRGQAAKIEALLLRACLADRYALPRPGKSKSFQGGATDVFRTGVIRNVHHCDIRSLYPSLMLARTIAPSCDERGYFLRLLNKLRAFRLEAKHRMQSGASAPVRREAESMQSTFKVLINSFYGYLGFEQARFNDYDAAAAVAAAGRAILMDMIEWIREQGGEPIEIDTDGIYFVPPDTDAEGQESFRRGLAQSLPEGIDVEFDGVYPVMFSYKRKNYALRTEDGKLLITGAALKSRGLEPFQRAFVRDWIEALLSGDERTRAEVIERYRRALRDREWYIRELAKTERLAESPAAYAEKRAAGGRARNAAQELAQASDRVYRAGDSVSYYVTGRRKSVPVHSHARLVSAWDPKNRDENVAYYEAKLEALIKKLESVVRLSSKGNAQGTLDLG